jgi:hypothetical protein
MFGNLFKKKSKQPAETCEYIVAQLNARIQPMHRGEFFEDPLNDELKKLAIGEVSGGGTMQCQNGEIEYCDIEIQVDDSSQETVQVIIDILERLGAPKNSRLKLEAKNSEVVFGVSDGLAVYLNGTDLPTAVYQECDSNFVFSEFQRLLGENGRVLSYWQGPTETALYLYGSSFADMHARIAGFISDYPLCQQCRIVQIA